MRVDVVIPAWGDDPWLERAVDSILASTGVDARAVVVDNGGDPATIDRLAARAGVTVVRPGENLGFANGCNAGAAAAATGRAPDDPGPDDPGPDDPGPDDPGPDDPGPDDPGPDDPGPDDPGPDDPGPDDPGPDDPGPDDPGPDDPGPDDIVAFLNQDAILEPTALAALAEVAARPDVGIASASVRLADAPDVLNSAGNPIHFLGFSWSGAYGEPAAAHPDEQDIAGASGAAMAMRRGAWDAVGGFAGEYFAYLEDAELSLRCWQQGLRVVYVPGAVVTHRYQFSRNPAKWYLLERNRLVLLLTIYERRTLLLLLPAALGVELGMCLVAARAGWLRPKLRGWAWVIRHRRWIGERRRQLQAARVVGDRDLAARLATRFDAANMGIPAWIGPLDAGLAGYWRVSRGILRRSRPLA